MTLNQLKVFATVVKFNGFTRAARVLRISQPSVSAVVHDLQKELGVKLFERLGNKRHLTEAGKLLYRRAESALLTIEGMQEDLEELQGLKKGKLLVGSAGMGTPLLLPAMQEFRHQHPGIEVALTVQRSETLHQKLLDGEVDVAILGRAPSSPLIAGEPFGEDELVFIAPPKHPLTRKCSVPLDLLAKEPLILYQRDAPLCVKIERMFAEAGLPFKPVLEIEHGFGSRDLVKKAVASGTGISYLTKCHVLDDVKAGKIKILRVPDLNLKRTMYIAAHRNRRDAALIKTFIDFLRNWKVEKA